MLILSAIEDHAANCCGEPNLATICRIPYRRSPPACGPTVVRVYVKAHTPVGEPQ